MLSIRIARPLSSSLVTGAALAMTAALVAHACWGEVTRKVTVHVVLLPAGGLINVAVPRAGVIAEALVREGDAVQAGQPLLRIRADRITSQGEAAQLTAQALAARRASLQTERRLTELNPQQRLEALASREQDLRAEERQALAELDTRQARVHGTAPFLWDNGALLERRFRTVRELSLLAAQRRGLSGAGSMQGAGSEPLPTPSSVKETFV